MTGRVRQHERKASALVALLIAGVGICVVGGCFGVIALARSATQPHHRYAVGLDACTASPDRLHVTATGSVTDKEVAARSYTVTVAFSDHGEPMGAVSADLSAAAGQQAGWRVQSDFNTEGSPISSSPTCHVVSVAVR